VLISIHKLKKKTIDTSIHASPVANISCIRMRTSSTISKHNTEMKEKWDNRGFNF